jgi:phage baseplate assembly protein V
MMQHFRNQLGLAAQLSQNDTQHTKVGIVTSYDPGIAAAKVRLQPEDPDNPDSTLTGWLPVATTWVGDGWGMDAPVSPGDQVEVKYFGAEVENGYISGRFYSDSVRPSGAKSGEFFLTHKTGSKIKLTNDGKLLINGNVEVDVTAPTVNITTTGNVAVTAGGQANVTAPAINLGASGQSLLSVITSAFVALFNGHTHNEHDGPATSQPNQQMGAAHMTSTVKAG